MQLAWTGQAWLMMPLGRRICKVPTWLAMRVWVVVAVRRMGPARPPGRLTLRA
jgi:hypothetical protein